MSPMNDFPPAPRPAAPPPDEITPLRRAMLGSALTGLSGLGGVLLPGCGGGDDAAAPAAPTPAPSAPAPSPTPPAPSPAPGPTPAPGPPAPLPPPSANLPGWVNQLALWQWAEIPNTALSSVDPSPRPLGYSGPASKVDAWCGATLKRAGSVYMLGAAGGHADYAGNEVNALALKVEVPAWQQLRAPTRNEDLINATQYYLDNRPSATHTYSATQFIESQNRMLVMASPGMNSGQLPAAPANFPYTGAARTYSFNVNTLDWDAPDHIALFPGNGDFTAALCCKHPVTEDIYYSRSYSDGFYRWRPSTNTWAKLSDASRHPWYCGSAIDPGRDRMLLIGGYVGVAPTDPTYMPVRPEVRALDGSTVSVTFGGLGHAAISAGSYSGVVYDEAGDCFLTITNGLDGRIKVLRVNASTWFVDAPPITGVPPANRANGIQNAAQYVPELKGIVLANRHNGNVYFMRTAL